MCVQKLEGKKTIIKSYYIYFLFYVITKNLTLEGNNEYNTQREPLPSHHPLL